MFFKNNGMNLGNELGKFTSMWILNSTHLTNISKKEAKRESRKYVEMNKNEDKPKFTRCS
jgi:hypothetical protein